MSETKSEQDTLTSSRLTRARKEYAPVSLKLIEAMIDESKDDMDVARIFPVLLAASATDLVACMEICLRTLGTEPVDRMEKMQSLFEAIRRDGLATAKTCDGLAAAVIGLGNTQENPS